MNSRIAIPVSGEDVSQFNPDKDIMVISIVPSKRMPDESKWKVHIGRTVVKDVPNMTYYNYPFHSQARRSIDEAFKEREETKLGFVFMLNGKAKHIISTGKSTWDSPEFYNVSFDSDVIDPFPIATKEQVIEYNRFNFGPLGRPSGPVDDYVPIAARPAMSSILHNFIQIGDLNLANKDYYTIIGIPVNSLEIRNYCIGDEENEELCPKIYEISYKFNATTKTCFVEKWLDNGRKEYYIGDGGPNKLQNYSILSLERAQTE